MELALVRGNGDMALKMGVKNGVGGFWEGSNRLRGRPYRCGKQAVLGRKWVAGLENGCKV